VEHAVDHEDRPAHVRRPARVDLTRAFAADDDRVVAATAAASAATATATATAPAGSAAGAAASARTGAGGEAAREPRRAEGLDGGLIDLRQRAVPPSGVIARVGGPRFAERLEQRGRIEAGVRLADLKGPPDIAVGRVSQTRRRLRAEHDWNQDE